MDEWIVGAMAVKTVKVFHRIGALNQVRTKMYASLYVQHIVLWWILHVTDRKCRTGYCQANNTSWVYWVCVNIRFWGCSIWSEQWNYVMLWHLVGFKLSRCAECVTNTFGIIWLVGKETVEMTLSAFAYISNTTSLSKDILHVIYGVTLRPSLWDKVLPLII